MKLYDVIIIGGGIYGLHAAFNDKFKNKNVVIIEKEDEILKGASLSNQARLHNGYHYPRSYDTAKSAKDFFDKCYKEYEFAINNSFKSIYAIAKNGSLTTANEFENFCTRLNIDYSEIDTKEYFKDDMIEKAYITTEYTFDTDLIRDYYVDKIKKTKNVEIRYNTYITQIEKEEDYYLLTLNNDKKIRSKLVISTVYQNINYVNNMFKQRMLDIKYELCEIELINVNENLKDVAITIMDGPFFSIMPFGKKNIHTLTSVNFTPHEVSFTKLPKFTCQQSNVKCQNEFIENCNECPYKPKSDTKRFLELYNQFMRDNLKFEYVKSLFAVKPILLASENDDSRPTVIERYTSNPTYISCLSGKFSTVYLLDEFIEKNIVV